MAAVIENRLGTYEKRKEQVRRYELFIESNNSSGDIAKKPRLEIESKKSKYKIRFPDGCVFLAACTSGSTDDVAELLRNSNTDINTTNVDGLTGLHQACINEDTEMVKFLVDKGIDVNTRDNEGWTALHAAAQSGFIEIAKFLLDKGARLDLINCDCELPVDLSQCKDMTRLLEDAMASQGIDGDKARNAEEQMMMEDIERWSSLGSYGGTVDEKTGASPLHVAAVKGYLDIMRLLIQLGAPIDAVDNEGWTAMHGAAHWGQEDSCRLLAENYCNLKAINHQGNTPLDVADPNVVDLLKELMEKQKSLPENISISRSSNKIRKSSITRMSAGQMKDLQRKNEEDEKPPPSSSSSSSSDLVEDYDSYGDTIKVESIREEGPRHVGRVAPQTDLGKIHDVEKIQDLERESAKKGEKNPLQTERPEEVLSEDRIQFLLEERKKKKLDQQRVSDSSVIMRRDTPRLKTTSEVNRPRLIASDLIRRSGDPSLWRLAFRRSSNSENDLEIGEIIQDVEKMKNVESGETDEDKELKRSGEQSVDSQQILEPIRETEQSSTHQSSLLRPETAAALASIASSHQRFVLAHLNTNERLNDSVKRDDANELERKLKAKRARESRRSTQGVTKEDIQRAEDTLKAAYQGLSKTDQSSEDQPVPEGGSVDVDSGHPHPVDSGHPHPVDSGHLHPVDSGHLHPVDSEQGVVLDSSVTNIIDKWQKVDSEGNGDLRAQVGSRGSVLGTPSLQKKDFSPETLILYRKMPDQPEDDSQREALNQQSSSNTTEIPQQPKDMEPVEDQTIKTAATRARRKRENRRSTGKISLEGNEQVPASDPEEADDSEQAPATAAITSSTSSSSTTTSMPVVLVTGTQRQQQETTTTPAPSTHLLPKAVPSTTSLPFTSTSNSLSRYTSSRLHQDPSSPSKFPSRDRWSAMSPWQQPSLHTPNARSSALLSSYDSSSNQRTASTGTNSAMLPTDYQKLWEQEKVENEILKKRNVQLERDLRNAQLDVTMATPSKGFDRIDAREKRNSDRKFSEVEEEKKLLEAKLASLEDELKKVESVKVENTKLKNENAALIRVISKLSK